MPKNIRNLIYELEYLSPVNNVGYSTETFHYYSSKLEIYSTEQLQTELNAMTAEGLIRLENKGTYWATGKGKITRQKMLAQRGLLSPCLVQQSSYSLDDLILAIAASAYVDPFSGSQSMPMDALSIYLNEFSDESVMSAAEALISVGLLKSEESRQRRMVHITGGGLRKYRNETRLRLDLGPTEGILRLLKPIQTDSRFSQLGLAADLQDNLAGRWIEMEACAENRFYLAAVILLGSVLEGVLRATLVANIPAAVTAIKAPKANGGVSKPVADWNLVECLSVAANLGHIPHSLEKESLELSSSQKLVHASKHVGEKIQADEALYRRLKILADTVLDALVQSRPTGNP